MSAVEPNTARTDAPRPGPARGRGAVRVRLVELAVRRQSHDDGRVHRGLPVQPLPGVRALEARGRAARAAQPRARRRTHGDRAGTLVLRAPPAPSPDAVLRRSAPRPLPARG